MKLSFLSLLGIGLGCNERCEAMDGLNSNMNLDR